MPCPTCGQPIEGDCPKCGIILELVNDEDREATAYYLCPQCRDVFPHHARDDEA